MSRHCATASLFLASICMSAWAADKTQLSEQETRRITELVAKLGSDYFAERQEAESALSQSKPSALKFLHAALEQSKDAEVRSRLQNVLQGILAGFCNHSYGYKVSLHFDEKPLATIMQEFARQVKVDENTFTALLPDATGKELVSIALDGVEDSFALHWLLRLGGFELLANPNPVERVYDLDGLCLRAAEIHDLLHRKCFAEETPTTLEAGKLKVHAPGDVQQRIEFILKQIRGQKDAKRIGFKLEDTSWSKAVTAMLQRKKVSFEFVDAPLEQALAYIQKKTSVPLICDPELFVPGATSAITLRVSDMSADLALNWVLRLADLNLSFKDHAVHISQAAANLPSERECLVLNLDDILNVKGMNLTLTNVADMLRNRVRPETWDAALGTTIEERDGRLVIVQSPEVVVLIDAMLDSFRAYMAMVRKVEPDGKRPDHPLKPEDVPYQRTAEIKDEPWKKELQDVLAKEIACQYDDQPLSEVLLDVSRKTGGKIILDPRVASEGADKTPITFRAEKMPGTRVLAWLMRLSELAYDLRNEAVFVTKRSHLGCNVKLYLYYVRDLSGIFSTEDIISLIKDKLMPNEFADPATSIEESDGVIVVMQQPEIHRKIQAVLTHVRLHGDEKTLMLNRIPELRAADDGLAENLAKKVKADFDNEKLQNILAKLQEQSGVTIVADPRLPADAEAVSLKLGETTLQDALAQIVKQCQVNFTFKDGAVWVGAGGHNLESIECGIYAPDEDTTAIAQLIHTMVAPENWDAATGTSIEERSGRLIVMQPPDQQKLITELLEKRRNEKK